MLLTLCSVLSIAYIIAATSYTILSLCSASRSSRTEKLKNYKKGKFLIHYPSSFPIYLAAFITAGDGAFWAACKAIESTIATAVFSFDFGLLLPIMSENILFFIATTLCVILVILNTVLFSLSLFSRRLMNFFTLRRIKNGKGDVTVLVGYSDKSLSVLTSMNRETVERKNRTKEQSCDVLVIVNELTDEFREKMYINRAAYIHCPKEANIANLIEKNCKSIETRHLTVIIQTQSDSDNLKYAFQISNLATKKKELASSTGVELGCGIDAYLFTEGNNDSVYRRITQASHGAVHCLNRYNMIARDFTSKYPITLFMQKMIDTRSAAFKPKTDFRLIMIGFGNVNRQLFCTYVQNSQLLMLNEDGTTKLMPIRCHVFDKLQAHDEATFNYTYMHYKHWLEGRAEGDSDGYFELPKLPADISFHELDVNTSGFSDEFKSCLTDSESGYNMVIISLGDDMSDLNLAEKIATYAKEKRVESKTKIFVRVRDKSLSEESAHSEENDVDIIPFGDIASLFSYSRILNHEADEIAKDRHLCYAVESKKASESDEDAKRDALYRWYFEWQNIQRESNAYAALSMRAKFNLLGYDIVKRKYEENDDSASFIADYTQKNPIEYKKTLVDGEEKIVTVNDKKLVDYTKEYHKPGTPRTNLAICEHARWNAYHICNGFIPASRDELKTEGKNSLLRRRKHINLTTMAGLDEYAKWRIAEFGLSDNDADVIKYDYQLMDDAVWLLHRSGYSIEKIKERG